jgi:tellurite methyltransferase
MSAHDRKRWDTRYQTATAEPYPEPDPLLFPYTPVTPNGAGHALDLACGLGQNGLWLAEQGYVVDLLDVSRVALLRAQEEMQRRQLRRLNIFHIDFDDHTLETARYDLICVFRFLERDLIPQIRAALKPGGRIIYETFHRKQLQHDPNFNANYLLEVGELIGYFADWRVLHHADLRYTSQVVAIKPTAAR